jgi:hypothetical protein
MLVAERLKHILQHLLLFFGIDPLGPNLEDTGAVRFG